MQSILFPDEKLIVDAMQKHGNATPFSVNASGVFWGDRKEDEVHSKNDC
jgi:hypothetical protein